MKYLSIIALLFFVSCSDESGEIEPTKDKKLCVYKVNTCTNANPLQCPPPLDFWKCIETWEASSYQNTRLYKLEDCERCNL